MQDNHQNSEITPRQAKILAAIVKENCDTSQPVASADLVEKYNFNISSPTIRNEMQALEKLGYIHQPHTSAGRVPAAAAYELFRPEFSVRQKKGLKENLSGLFL